MTVALVTASGSALGREVAACVERLRGWRVVRTARHPSSPDVLPLDVTQPRAVEAVLDDVRPDIVFHVAATTSADFDQAFAINVEGTRRVLEAVATRAPGARVLLTGSAAEYGVVEPEENPVREDRVLRPVSVYGLTKAWQTQLAGLYGARGIGVVVARVFNLDGPGLPERLFVGRLHRQIADVLAGRAREIACGPLGAVRDYVPLADAARQVVAIARQGESGGVYHVGSGRPVTMRAVLEGYLAANGLDPALVREAPELSNRSGYDVPVIYADMTRTQALLRAEGERDEA